MKPLLNRAHWPADPNEAILDWPATVHGGERRDDGLLTEPDPDDVAQVVFTSGTTGAPKVPKRWVYVDEVPMTVSGRYRSSFSSSS